MININPILLHSNDCTTKKIVASGIINWDDLISAVQRFPYGRNKNRSDLSLVWVEKKGTCSSKHAFLKMIADLNAVSGVSLILCIYKMKGTNTPKIGKVLEDYNFDYIPEAHCYLQTEKGPLDITNVLSDFGRIKDDILESLVISPYQVASFKVNYHKKYIQNWAKENSNKSFEEIWAIREECIKALEQ